MTTSRSFAVALLAAALTAALPAAAIEYTLVEIKPPTGFADYFTVSTGLNASGQVTGYVKYPLEGGGIFRMNSQAFVTGPDGAGVSSLGTLGSSTWSQGAAINDAGQVAGTARTTDGGSRAFVAAAGSPMRDLGTLGGVNSEAHAINARGQVIGSADTSTGTTRSFLSTPQPGALRDLAPSPGTPVYARDWTGLNINGAGQVAGSVAGTSYGTGFHNIVTGPDGSAPRVYAQPGTPEDTDDPVINDINDNGDVLMTVWNEYNPTRTPLYLIAADGSATPVSFVGVPEWEDGKKGGSGQYGPVTQTQGLALNDSGQLAGYFTNHRKGQSYAFITGAGGRGITLVRDLDFVGATEVPTDFTEVTDINDAGQFVVNTGSWRSFLVTPVPEPSSLALLLAGTGLVGLTGRRSVAKKKAMAGQR